MSVRGDTFTLIVVKRGKLTTKNDDDDESAVKITMVGVVRHGRRKHSPARTALLLHAYTLHYP